MVYHDAELRDWALYRREGFVVAAGRIFGDKKERWSDGRLIQTSALLTPGAARAGAIIATLNSHYLLVGPRFQLDDPYADRARRDSDLAHNSCPNEQLGSVA